MGELAQSCVGPRAHGPDLGGCDPRDGRECFPDTPFAAFDFAATIEVFECSLFAARRDRFDFALLKRRDGATAPREVALDTGSGFCGIQMKGLRRKV